MYVREQCLKLLQKSRTPVRPSKSFLTLALALMALSCSDDVTHTYCTKYRVMCGFAVASYPELMAVVNNAGQFGTVRASGGNIIMTSFSSSTSYSMGQNKLQEDFLFGLGGLIIGTNNFVELRAYDLACPNCDHDDRRLTLSDDGSCRCAKCGIEYDMNNDGVILDKGDGTHTHPRGLYRYPVQYDGMTVQVIN